MTVNPEILVGTELFTRRLQCVVETEKSVSDGDLLQDKSAILVLIL